MKRLLLLTGLLCQCLFIVQSQAYPIDGFEATGIRRLRQAELINSKKMAGPMLPAGARHLSASISLNPSAAGIDLSETDKLIDSRLNAGLEALFSGKDPSYSVAILDITPGKKAKLSLFQAQNRFAVGSVGKLAVAAGLFNELYRLFPESTQKRQDLLKNRLVTAGPWIEIDSHEVPACASDDGSCTRRPVHQGDVFSLYEWADHMISASANSAASTVWKELVLMRYFGKNYPPSAEQEASFFSSTSRQAMSSLAAAVVNDPLGQIGISRNEFHLGNLFTSEGKKRIPGEGDSSASPLGLLKYLLSLEQGRIVDAWSSLEIKKLLYTTTKRIRYASSPVLNTAAVYFKSGSLYRCAPEPGYTCRKYKGNKDNIMNSVAIIEHTNQKVYLVTLMSNVLKKNSAVDHQELAEAIDKLIQTDPESP